MLTSRLFVSALSLAVLFVSSVAVAAGPADHQQCFKIKDPAPKATYSADLLPSDVAFPHAVGCKIQVPAKLLCIDVVKSNVAPPPPGSDPGEAAQKSLCYKLKCPKIAPAVAVQDQFGSRTVQVKGSMLLCAPFPAASPTTTSTSTTTTLPGSCTTTGDCAALPNALPVCMASTCTVGSCNVGYANCNGLTADGCEVNIAGDTSNCGGCGLVCNLPNATEGCSGSACTVGSCDAGYADCNVSPVDGCEVNTTGDTSNCGGCGLVCSTNHAIASCNASNCSVGSCNAGYLDCDNNPTNGCEINTTNDPANCGFCGVTCPVLAPNCSASTCAP